MTNVNFARLIIPVVCIGEPDKQLVGDVPPQFLAGQENRNVLLAISM